jgi:DNA-binding Lrp family transcriptional regulator
MNELDRTILDELDDETATNIFELYDAVDADPEQVRNALQRLSRQGDVFRPTPYRIQAI